LGKCDFGSFETAKEQFGEKLCFLFILVNLIEALKNLFGPQFALGLIIQLIKYQKNILLFQKGHQGIDKERPRSLL
jgi:hypothetical protein